MNPKPLYRSVTFWLGLIVLSFLIWALADSMRYYSRGYATIRERVVCLSIGAGELGLITWSDPYVLGSTFHRDRTSVGRLMPSTFWPRFGTSDDKFNRALSMPRRASPAHIESSPGYTRTVYHLNVPQAFPVALFSSLWLALLFWRARRIKRAAQAITPAP